MKKKYVFSADEMCALKSLVGRGLESYRLNETDDTSFEIFVLRLSDTDFEIATNDATELNDVFGDVVTVAVSERPKRDSWSRVGKSEPDNGIPEGGFKDYPVHKLITGVSTIIETVRSNEEECEFVRGIVLDLDGLSLVFDKGAYAWESIWRVCHDPISASSLPSAEFDSIEEPGMSSITRIERIG